MAILVFVCGAVAVTEETFEAIFATELADNLVKCLSVKSIIINSKRRIADGWK